MVPDFEFVVNWFLTMNDRLDSQFLQLQFPTSSNRDKRVTVFFEGRHGASCTELLFDIFESVARNGRRSGGVLERGGGRKQGESSVGRR